VVYFWQRQDTLVFNKTSRPALWTNQTPCSRHQWINYWQDHRRGVQKYIQLHLEPRLRMRGTTSSFYSICFYDVHHEIFTVSSLQCKTTDEATLKFWAFKKMFQCNLSRAELKVITLLTQEAVLCNIITEIYSKQCKEKRQIENTSDT
jgi:hypothetical protein